MVGLWLTTTLNYNLLINYDLLKMYYLNDTDIELILTNIELVNIYTFSQV